MIHFDSPCPRSLSSAGLLQPLQMGCGEWRLQLQWPQWAGGAQLAPAPPAQKHSGLGESFREERKEERRGRNSSGLVYPACPWQLLSIAKSPCGEFLFAAVSPPSVKFCPLVTPWWHRPLSPRQGRGREGRDCRSAGSDLARFFSLSRHQIMLKALASSTADKPRSRQD